MLLTGNYRRSLDDKFRLAIPKAIRDALGSETALLFIAPGTDGTLNVYTEPVLRDLGESLAKKSPVGQESRTFSRLFYSQVQQLDLDSQGRIRIPAELVEWARIENEIVLIGVRDHLEIWASNAWEQFLENRKDEFDQLALISFSDRDINENVATDAIDTTSSSGLPRRAR